MKHVDLQEFLTGNTAHPSVQESFTYTNTGIIIDTHTQYLDQLKEH